MRFTETPLTDAWIVDLAPISDERGFFSRMFCANEFRDHGMAPVVAQGNLSFNHHAGTMRGMHYQVPPATETKLVRCTKGAVYDAIVDLRPESSTYLQSFGVELTAENRRALYVPGMFGHGYLTLTDGAEVEYLVSEFYTPGAERGLHHDDPVLDITWPMDVAVISDKDASWPEFVPADHEAEHRSGGDRVADAGQTPRA